MRSFSIENLYRDWNEKTSVNNIEPVLYALRKGN